MKCLPKIFVKTAALVFGLFLAGCQTDLYEREEPAPKPEELGESLSGIPNDFDYATVESKKLTVRVMDTYEGKKYYTVEVFDANPFNDTSAKVLAGGKTNQNTPFEVELVLPKTLSTIYIRQTDPRGYRSVTGLAVEEGDLYFDYNEVLSEKAVTKASSGAAGLRSSLDETGGVADYDKFFTARLKEAKEITGGEKLETGGVYKLTKAYKGVMRFPEGKFTLYIDNKLTLEKGVRDYRFQGGEIYILKGASLESVGQAVDITLSGSKLFNAGTVALSNIGMTGSELYNHPDAKIYARNLTIGGTNVYNNCLLKIENAFTLEGAASQVICGVVSSVVAAQLQVNAESPIVMRERSLFEIDRIDGKSSGRYGLHANVTGMAWGDFGDLPLFKVNGTLVLDQGGGFDDTLTKNHITFTGNVCYAAKKVVSAGAGSSFQLDYGKLPTDAQGDCYGVQYKPSEETTPDSEDPQYNQQGSETPTYTYLFEDNWPVFGDYDMNDLVLDVNIANIGVMNNNATSVVLTTTVRAVGASKPLYAFAQIEAPGVGKTIVPLFEGEAHAFLGKTTNDKINTFNYTCDNRTTVQTVEVKGIKGLVNALNLNVFLVWGDVSGEKWNEVHLPYFKATARAAHSATTGDNYKYNGKVEGAKTEYDNMMWALMVPTKDFASYPKEAVSIMTAYDEFMEWAKSGGAVAGDWYTRPVAADKIYQGKAPEPEKKE